MAKCFIVVIVMMLFPGFVSAMTFSDVDKILQKQSSEPEIRTKEERSEQLQAINNFWQQTGPCHSLEGKKSTQIIMQIGNSGLVTDAWSDSSNPKASCFKDLAKELMIYPRPRTQPYYVKVIL